MRKIIGELTRQEQDQLNAIWMSACNELKELRARRVELKEKLEKTSELINARMTTQNLINELFARFSLPKPIEKGEG
jgi:hypothetical protein